MALIRADSKAIFTEGESLFVVRDNDFVQRFESQWRSVLVSALDEHIDVKPACSVETHSDGLRLVPKNHGQELARLDEVFFQFDSVHQREELPTQRRTKAWRR